MQDYKELYNGKGITLLGVYENYGAYIFRAELSSYTFSGLDMGFSGSALFYFTHNEENEYCKKLRNMYELLSGECLILDCEFGNTIKLYFSNSKLILEGYFNEGVQTLKFCEEVDQTIIPKIISLFQKL